MPLTNNSTLAEAKLWLQSRLENGTRCPCCTQHAKIYERKLNSGMARSLIWLVKAAAVSADGWVDLVQAPKFVHQSRELAKLVHWKLIVELDEESQRGARTSGIWRPTPLGIEFVEGKIVLPAQIRLYDGHFLGFVDKNEVVNIRQSLGKRFNYEELWTSEPARVPARPKTIWTT